MADQDQHNIGEAAEIVEAALEKSQTMLAKHCASFEPHDVVRLAEVVLDRAFLIKHADEDDDDDSSGEDWKNR